MTSPSKFHQFHSEWSRFSFASHNRVSIAKTSTYKSVPSTVQPLRWIFLTDSCFLREGNFRWETMENNPRNHHRCFIFVGNRALVIEKCIIRSITSTMLTFELCSCLVLISSFNRTLNNVTVNTSRTRSSSPVYFSAVADIRKCVLWSVSVNVDVANAPKIPHVTVF